MKDWKASVRTWEGRDNAPAAQPIRSVPAQSYTQRDYSGEQEAAMRRMIGGKVLPAQQFTQRDYSHEEEDAINRMLAMGKEARA